MVCALSFFVFPELFPLCLSSHTMQRRGEGKPAVNFEDWKIGSVPEGMSLFPPLLICGLRSLEDRKDRAGKQNKTTRGILWAEEAEEEHAHF